jgi:hypothetical protein
LFIVAHVELTSIRSVKKSGKKRKKEKDRKEERKREGAPYDKNKSLFLNGFLFLFLFSFAQQTPRSKLCLGSTSTRVLCIN